MSLTRLIEEFLSERGALRVGIATRESLAGGPPSAELRYKLEGAKSAVSFALALNRDAIMRFLAKEERTAHEEDNLKTNLRAKELSWELAELIKREGHAAKGTAANNKYRTEIANWQFTMPPDLSHRYLAARSGVGSFGWSGNVGIKGIGTAIILGTCLTAAELEPTPPVPEGEKFCDKCKLCVSSCAVEMFSKEEETAVTLGGVSFNFSARKNIILCQFCCGGFTGLAKSGKWSTWSPGRFKAPEDGHELGKEFFRAVGLYAQRPPMPGGYEHSALKGAKQYMTCGNCQLVCGGDRKETTKRVKLLHQSGCVLQREDGSLYARPAGEAEREFERMPEERKRLYC